MKKDWTVYAQHILDAIPSFPSLQRGNAYRAFNEVQISMFILQVIWIFYPSTLVADIVRAIATIRMRSHAGAMGTRDLEVLGYGE